MLKGTLLSLLMCRGISIFFVSFCSAGQNTLHVLDVGFGDCMILTLSDGVSILIDAGGKEDFKRVLSYLQTKKINPRYAVLTHPHENHYGGMIDLLDHINLQAYYWNGDPRDDGGGVGLLFQKIHDQAIPVHILHSRQTWPISDDVTIEVLWPDELKYSINNNALVLLVNIQGQKILLMSDVEKDFQEMVIDRVRDPDAIHFVTVPHHGGALHPVFHQKLVNKTFIVNTGQNPFGLPSEEDLERLKGTVLRTDEKGNMEFSF
ncbi:MAG: MBL fold metallo-hydrolase [Candidatus Omnitrophica bacterium]|nr:MBL fold metallo-hydrolase [Candidatus Omnitrophota bacterium]